MKGADSIKKQILLRCPQEDQEWLSQRLLDLEARAREEGAQHQWRLSQQGHGYKPVLDDLRQALH
jgi:hypothetical protein